MRDWRATCCLGGSFATAAARLHSIQGTPMRSIEFFTYLLPDQQSDGQPRPSRFKLTRWQAVAWPGATCVEESRELRMCPESAAERQLLGVPGLDESEPAQPSRG
jgi:hypothetical protein